MVQGSNLSGISSPNNPVIQVTPTSPPTRTHNLPPLVGGPFQGNPSTSEKKLKGKESRQKEVQQQEFRPLKKSQIFCEKAAPKLASLPYDIEKAVEVIKKINASNPLKEITNWISGIVNKKTEDEEKERIKTEFKALKNALNHFKDQLTLLCKLKLPEKIEAEKKAKAADLTRVDSVVLFKSKLKEKPLKATDDMDERNKNGATSLTLDFHKNNELASKVAGSLKLACTELRSILHRINRRHFELIGNSSLHAKFEPKAKDLIFMINSISKQIKGLDEDLIADLGAVNAGPIRFANNKLEQDLSVFIGKWTKKEKEPKEAKPAQENTFSPPLRRKFITTHDIPNGFTCKVVLAPPTPRKEPKPEKNTHEAHKTWTPPESLNPLIKKENEQGKQGVLTPDSAPKEDKEKEPYVQFTTSPTCMDSDSEESGADLLESKFKAVWGSSDDESSEGSYSGQDTCSDVENNKAESFFPVRPCGSGVDSIVTLSKSEDEQVTEVLKEVEKENPGLYIKNPAVEALVQVREELLQTKKPSSKVEVMELTSSTLTENSNQTHLTKQTEIVEKKEELSPSPVSIVTQERSESYWPLAIKVAILTAGIIFFYVSQED